MSVTEEFAGREVMALPISAGTSLAIEAACGQYPDRPENPAPLLSYGEFWFNLRTMVRNLLQSVKAQTRNQAEPQHIVPVLKQEMDVITEAIRKASSGQCVARFYCADYRTLARDFPNAVHRTLTGERMIFAQALEERSLSELLKLVNLPEQPKRVETFAYGLSGSSKPTLILTHVIVDLLSKSKFPRLDLIESNTGVLKPSTLWYTKLTGGKDLPPLPLNRFTLQIFGDNGVNFAPFPRNLREMVVELARKDHWTPLTTNERIKFSLEKLPHKADADRLKQLF